MGHGSASPVSGSAISKTAGLSGVGVVGGAALTLEDGASIESLGQTCKELDAAARKATRWKKPEPVEGTSAVEIYWRVSAARYEKRYLGDATGIVLIEKLVSVQRR